MVLLIDTNVILDYFFHRDPSYKEATVIFLLLKSKKIKGVIAFHTISTLAYVLKKKVLLQDTMRILSCLLSLTKVASASHDRIKQIFSKREVIDIEDELQLSCALEANASAIITNDKKGFKNSPIDVFSPKEFIDFFERTHDPLK